MQRLPLTLFLLSHGIQISTLAQPGFEEEPAPPEEIAILDAGNTTSTTVCGLSFEDATDKCLTNTACTDMGAECPPGEACFTVNCTVVVDTNATIEEGLSTSPTIANATLDAPVSAPTPPDHVFVCGVDYGDADTNCLTNTGCPTGDGCDEGLTCFAIPFGDCQAVTTVGPTEAANVTTATVENVTMSTVAVGGTGPAGVTTVASENVTTPAAENITTPAAEANVTDFVPVTTKAPLNTFFCGESYDSALETCFTATPCPSGAGCPEDQACFDIAAECTAPVPTEAPSVPAPGVTAAPVVPAAITAAPSASPVTASPSGSPVINTSFCGVDYTDASENCSAERGCPGGFECPSGETCFAGITCAATAGEDVSGLDVPIMESVPTASPGGGTSAPSSGGTLMGSVTGTSSGSVAASTFVSTPDAGKNVTAAETNVTESVFDPNITSYCGTDYNDAQDNCYKATQCPGNSNAECPMGQTCFPGIVGCAAPEGTMAPSPTMGGNDTFMGGNETEMGNETAPAEGPTVSPTPKPVYDLSGFGEGSGGRNAALASGYNAGVLVTGVAGIVATFML